jgi:hypothetical protein
LKEPPRHERCSEALEEALETRRADMARALIDDERETLVRGDWAGWREMLGAGASEETRSLLARLSALRDPDASPRGSEAAPACDPSAFSPSARDARGAVERAVASGTPPAAAAADGRSPVRSAPAVKSGRRRKSSVAVEADAAPVFAGDDGADPPVVMDFSGDAYDYYANSYVHALESMQFGDDVVGVRRGDD